ncbi:MAG TPA: NADH-quinone oxidoreductase subunit NuoE [Thermopetrobacter sp.]|nr:NADH-quinone oxidoreductase subunit NuoE [Thermopetrobacter sp.]
MSFRRLHHEQPDSFAFTEENLRWAKKVIARYPKGREASAVIPLLWRAQEQEGWTTEPMIRAIAEMLNMPPIRVLEVATFYTMFQLKPVGGKAHIQVCGTTPCMLRGAGELIKVCKRRIHEKAHELSSDGDFSWEEVECLGACANAPMIQIGEKVYEDLTPERMEEIIDELAAGGEPKPGPQNGRHSSEPLGGPTTLKGKAKGIFERGSDAEELIALARAGRKLPDAATAGKKKSPSKKSATAKKPAKVTLAALQQAAPKKPRLHKTPPKRVDDLKMISGIGPKLEKLLHELGVYTFRQIASWGAAEIRWVDDHLKFKGRIVRDDWVAQAEALATGGAAEYIRRFGKKPR